MLAYTTFLLGLVALSDAAPRFSIGDCSTILFPGGGNPSPNPVGPIQLPPVNGPGVKAGKRDIDEISFEQQPSTVVLAERTEDLNALKETYLTLLESFTRVPKPAFGTYMVLLHLADILASKGVKVATIIPGDATTIFNPSTTEKRQIFEVGSCNASDVIGLRATLTSVLLISGNTPSFEIWNLEPAIIAALKACNEDDIVGPIIPDKPTPGGPLVPDKPVPGGPIVTQSPVPGGPTKPSGLATASSRA
ncbi:hypothetical protein CORC01_14339 [Colletotrichum orchidophilum]|uniref:Uncharacterized protein n=1 Tax=Colletotrichum orchidophilum TaxID=1209926 RepID=A0A1G4AMN8_9PEZI|nr:uncharacterized protein CORC01_14339 [Colletotrichum orchidophilum]OHE90366.1 hypothetical protein CORC01_14339 [Colletotrichum orchidophilum]